MRFTPLTPYAVSVKPSVAGVTMSSEPSPVLVGMVDRLRRAGLAVNDAREAYDAARELRDALVIQAIDEGMQQQVVAAAAGISRSRVIAILSTSSAA